LYALSTGTNIGDLDDIRDMKGVPKFPRSQCNRVTLQIHDIIETDRRGRGIKIWGHRRAPIYRSSLVKGSRDLLFDFWDPSPYLRNGWS